MRDEAEIREQQMKKVYAWLARSERDREARREAIRHQDDYRLPGRDALPMKRTA